MKDRRRQPARTGLFIFAAIWMLVVVPLSAVAAPYAAHVIDARTGEVLHSHNSRTRLHPASLTKMMTLYIAFEAIEKGEISADTVITISKNAAAEPPSKLGLRHGQKIALRYLIRAAAVKSANDAATAIGEAISGSEAKFARRMNRTAKALGMTRTTFKNAHGLTENGHMSTAEDMTKLGRHMLYDYPDYYHLFSRKSADAGMKRVPNTNSRMLSNYRGADGIKTGYTRAAGFNLVASAERGNERIIATVFGGKSTASRNAQVAKLLDLGFRRAPSRAPLRKPVRPQYVAEAAPKGASGKTIRLVTAVKKSLRPQTRPVAEDVIMAAATQEDDAMRALIDAAVTEAQATPAPETVTAAVNTLVAEVAGQTPEVQATAVSFASITPMTRPSESAVKIAKIRPTARPANLALASAPAKPEIATRISTSGGRHWGVNVGTYESHYKAQKVLLQTALLEMSSLDGSLRKVVKRSRGFEANFLGMSRETAELACRRLAARNVGCTPMGPAG